MSEDIKKERANQMIQEFFYDIEIRMEIYFERHLKEIKRLYEFDHEGVEFNEEIQCSEDYLKWVLNDFFSTYYKVFCLYKNQIDLKIEEMNDTLRNLKFLMRGKQVMKNKSLFNPDKKN